MVRRLLNKGCQVICVDDLSTGYKDYLPINNSLTFINSKIQKLDIEDLENDINGIFHLSAQASVPVSMEKFYYSSNNNLQSSIRVFDLARKLQIPIVYASSSAVYGNLPLGDDQKDKYEILSPYAQDKLTMEHYAKLCYDVYKVSSIGLRFFNVYGPRQDPTNPYSGVISIFIDRLLDKKSVTVNGGYQTRDFIYVDDIVNVLSKAMVYLRNNNACEVLNVGTGISTTIDKILSTLSKILNIEPKINLEKLPIGDPVKSSGTFYKLQQTFGIDINKFTSVHIGLEKTMEYFRKELNK